MSIKNDWFLQWVSERQKFIFVLAYVHFNQDQLEKNLRLVTLTVVLLVLFNGPSSIDKISSSNSSSSAIFFSLQPRFFLTTSAMLCVFQTTDNRLVTLLAS
jgi:hypothetical protein